MQVELNEQQIGDVARMKAWRPCMIVAGAINPATGEFRVVVGPTMAKANNLARKGWKVFLAK